MIRSHKTFLPVLLLLVLLSVLLSACSSFSLAEDIAPPPGSEQMPSAPQQQQVVVSGPLYPLVPPDPANGNLIYAEKCAPCHGDFGMGDGPRAAQLPNPVSAIGSPDVARLATPADWYTAVTQGNLEKFMPPFNSLSDRERWDVVAYAFSLSTPSDVRQMAAGLYQDNCARCHGDTGAGGGPDAASLSRQPADLTNQEYVALKTEAEYYQVMTDGKAPDMPAFGADLNEDERRALAGYLRWLSFSSADPHSGLEAALTPSPDPHAGIITSTQTTTATTTTAGVGIVTGLVTNDSGESLPADLQVTLRGFDNMTSVVTQTTTIQPDGVYTFPDVEMPDGRVFMTTLEFKGATYGSDLGFVEPGKPQIDLPISIFGTTTDASILKGDRLHLFFEFVDAQNLRVIELYIVSNPTDKTLVAASEGEPTVRFNLPEGAANLEFQDGTLGDRYVELPGGFGDTIAIRPGEGSYEALFAYLMPYDKKLELKLPISLSVDAVVLLVPEGNFTIESDQLTDGGTRDVQGTPYHTYSGSPIQAGEELSITITGKPSAGAPTLAPSDNTALIVGLSVFGVTLVLAGVWLYRRTRKVAVDEEDDDEPPSVPGVPAENAETVMDAILALDDLYQAGKLPEEAYRQRRAELKARLKELMG